MYWCVASHFNGVNTINPSKKWGRLFYKMVEVGFGKSGNEKFFLSACHGLNYKLLVVTEEEEAAACTTCFPSFEDIASIYCWRQRFNNLIFWNSILSSKFSKAVDKICLNLHVPFYNKNFCILFLILHQIVEVSIKRQVRIAQKFLLLRILPCFKVLNLDFIKVDAEGKVINFILWNLAILPRFKVFLVCRGDNSLKDSIYKLNIQWRSQKRIQRVFQFVIILTFWWIGIRIFLKFPSATHFSEIAFYCGID